ncbi:SGS-domain-containing protein [Cucurbitaria berberidis CBS 394.84]|uniref:SGS-domain-containing protein n=1 Tax=Cucurbitaria berberidis CBS 394.84 TaxID=1168544 RepID=A0A9P4LAI7_9PLEO|nr:SGS-domain-containing protein [Cucurbitaria berberidis CBS 394.84]KAF1848090.1 SGS-domain-containing protein [Cucurbitaria berberidis CBS 394.84]
MDHARKGEAALSASKYAEAIQHFTDALAVSPNAVKYYINRSTAYQRSSKYTEALADADLAVALAHKRGARELIKDAQSRRALTLFSLERYGDAEYLFGIVKEIDPKDKMLPMWNVKLAAKLKDIPDGDDRRKVTVKNVPDVQVTSASMPSNPAKGENDAPKKTDMPASSPKPVVPTPANKIKVDWYQNNESVTITILAKGVPKESATVEIEKDTFSISFPISGSTSDYSYVLDPLYAPIDPAQSKYQIKSTKVEVTLKKEMSGVKWHNLEGDREVKAEGEGEGENKSTIPFHILTNKSRESAPVYPTSSKSGTKNWDKLADEEADNEEIRGDETSHFFQKLYKDASPDQQRAMMKSYQESGGTVLSTDWKNVGDKTVVPQPPNGMEAKEY